MHKDIEKTEEWLELSEEFMKDMHELLPDIADRLAELMDDITQELCGCRFGLQGGKCYHPDCE